MTGLPCAQARELLPWFVGGDLVDDRLGAVRQHLVHCVPCRREAASLQQATKAIRSVRVLDPGIDDAVFVAMHADIMAAVERHEARFDRASGGARGLSGRLFATRFWIGAAAMLLVAVGCWIGAGQGATSLLQRPPLATPASMNRQLTAVPYAGRRSEPFGEWRLLGDETGSDAEDLDGSLAEGWSGGVWPTDGMGQGMMGRDRLRPLVEGQFQQTLRVPRQR